MCASSNHIWVCGSVCVCVCVWLLSAGELYNIAFIIYIIFEVSHTHCCSCKAQCARPCQWDIALQTWLLIKSITEGKALSTSLSMRGKLSAPTYQWGKSPQHQPINEGKALSTDLSMRGKPSAPTYQSGKSPQHQPINQGKALSTNLPQVLLTAPEPAGRRPYFITPKQKRHQKSSRETVSCPGRTFRADHNHTTNVQSTHRADHNHTTKLQSMHRHSMRHSLGN